MYINMTVHYEYEHEHSYERPEIKMNINIIKNLNIGRDTSTVKDITETDTEMDKACRGFPVPAVLSML
jgi:hypothetical protein